jgi:hypothetical protein
MLRPRLLKLSNHTLREPTALMRSGGAIIQTNAQCYIVEINAFDGSEVSVFIQDEDGRPLSAEYAIVMVDTHGASIIDSAYRSVAEAKTAWPEAREPGANHLTPSAADERAIPGAVASPKLSH